MKWMIVATVCLSAAMVARAAPEDEYAGEMVDDASGRFLSLNTSSTASSLTLLGAVILIGVIAYLIYVGGLIGTSYYYGYNRNGYENGPYDNQGNYDQSYAQYRSNNDGYDFNSLNILQWISMLQDVYEKFDYNDLECQKRLICEVMKEPEYFGTAAQKFKSGFQYAKYLEVLSLPDDMRELLDEYLDANARSEQQKECEEFFSCPYSIKDSVKRNLSSNDL